MAYPPADLKETPLPVQMPLTVSETKIWSAWALSTMRAANCTVVPNRSLSSAMGSPALMPIFNFNGNCGLEARSWMVSF